MGPGCAELEGPLDSPTCIFQACVWGSGKDTGSAFPRGLEAQLCHFLVASLPADVEQVG